MHSAIYEGIVRHRRRVPVRHEFEYRLFLMYLDLSELDDVFRDHWLWGRDRWAVAQFRRTDHFGDADITLEKSVRDLIAAHGFLPPEGPIRLLTHLRYFGYVMNPVSFYYCFDRAGERVDFVVAEVTNTPWGERHCYVLDVRDSSTDELACRHAKEFHVSPFLEMGLEYQWRLTPPGETLAVGITNLKEGEPIFDADLRLHRQEITTARLARVLVAYPWLTARIFVSIYVQALRLWRKGIPFVPHPRSLTHREASVS